MSVDQMKKGFIGHKKDFAFFRRWLDTIEPLQPSILFLYDEFEEPERKGGIGKTWTLNAYAEEAAKRQDVAVVRVDFFNILDRDGPEIARRVVDGVKKIFPDWTPNNFEQAHAHYRQDLQLEKRIGGLRDLRSALVLDLAQLSQKLNDGRRHIIIFCDTYERVELHPEQLSLSSDYLFPDNYGCPLVGFVIAGRNAPRSESTNWHGRRFHQLAIKPFTSGEIHSYLQERIRVTDVLPLSAEDIETLYKRTQGRPILVGLLTDMLNARVLSLSELREDVPGDFEEYLVEQINKLNTLTDWIVLCMAQIYHRFNRAILRELFTLAEVESTPGTSIDEIWEHLHSLSFVRRSATSEDIALHDEMRRMVLRWCWERQASSIGLQQQELSECAIAYYNQTITREQSVSMRQAYQAEKLYHLLYLDEVRGFTKDGKGFTFFLEQMQHALDLRQYIYARSLLQEVHIFENKLLPEQIYILKEQEATLLQNEERYEDALKLYKDLFRLKDIVHSKEHRAYLLHEEGICYTRLRRLPEAIYMLTRSLEMYQTQHNRNYIAITDNRIGYAYFKQGDLDTAIKYYTQGLELHREGNNQVGYADILNSMGMVYIMQGKLDLALRHCQIALRQRQKLYKEQKMSEVGVAFSLSTVGDVYYRLGDATRARNYYQQAYDIYGRYANRQGRASTCIHFGHLALDDGVLQEANEWYKRAADFALHFDAESEVRSLNGQSRVLFKQHKTNEAIVLIQRAIKRAREIKDFYQQAESMVELARMLLQSGRFEEAQSGIAEAESLAKQYNYFHLLGSIMEIQGDAGRKIGHYLEAFRFYTLYCYYMARYNQTEYRKAVLQTLDYLIALPEDIVGPIWHQTSDDWSALELNKQDHEYMEQALNDVRSFLDL